MSVTLKHVAKKAGLSWQTVSKVLNDQGHLFRPETRKKVISTAKQMGYVPNAAARSMRAKQTRQIGLLLRNEEGHRYHNMAAFVLLLGMNTRLEEEGYLLSVVRVGEVYKRGATQSRVFEERVLDGLVAFSEFTDEVEKWVSDLIPNCLWVDSNRDSPVNCLKRDEKQVGLCVAEHILKLGYRKVVWAGEQPTPHSHFSQHDRYGMIAQKMAEHGIPFSVTPSLQNSNKRWLYHNLAQDLKPDSVLVAYNLHAAQAIMVGAASMGLMIGRDYGLICCDETPEVDESWPGLCRVANNRFEMGYQAADMMLQILKAPSHQVPTRHLPGQWVIGNTAWGPGHK